MAERRRPAGRARGRQGAISAGTKESRPSPEEPDDLLRLCGVQAYGHLGVTQRERDLGQRVEADVELAYPPVGDRRPDTLDAVIDYEDVHRVVRSQIEMSRCRLLETLAEELALALLAAFEVPRVRIRLRKLHVPVAGFHASPEVEIVRRRP
ncbi:MAG TPA: dihydroneopterin aldolase [Candidatus Eisenbacteria bacterium]|jgi:dihydroneopterin aldolase